MGQAPESMARLPAPRAGGGHVRRAARETGETPGDSDSFQVGFRRAQSQLAQFDRQVHELQSIWAKQARILAELAELGDRLHAQAPGAADEAARHRGTAPAWESCRTSLVLPAGLVEGIWARAARWHVDAGGRFQTVGSLVLLWSGPRLGHGAAPRIQAFAVLESQQLEAKRTAVTHLAWKAAQGGSPEGMWRALETLAGEPLARGDLRR